MDGPILVVDDFELDFETAARGFRRAGVANPLVHASTAEKAEQVLGELKPAMILLDLVLPDANGFEVLEAVRANPKLRDVPVAVWSGVYSHDRARLAYMAGANYFFTKRAEPDAQRDIELVVYALLRAQNKEKCDDVQQMRDSLENAKSILAKARETMAKLRELQSRSPGERLS